MFKKTTIVLALLSGSAFAQDAKTVIANAQKALGEVKSITYSGSAKDVSFQQCGANVTQMICQGQHDPMRPINSYVRVIDLTANSSRATGDTNNIGGGGSTTAAPGKFNQQITPNVTSWSAANNGSPEFYLTPWGFLKGAAENNATVSKSKGFTVLTWSPTAKAPSGKAYVIKGYINGQNMVDHVETWIEDNIMGDMQVVSTYSDWKDFGGAKVPAKIVEMRGGWPFFEVAVTAAQANPANVASLVPAPVPPAGKGGPAPLPNAGAAKGGAPAAPPAMVVTNEKLGDGLYRLTTGNGSYDSVIVEFKDHVMMLEAGQSIARGEAYIAETKKLIPGKPIRYVFVTHPHSDHTGGLPALVAEGATIITHSNNKLFLERALNTPRTLMIDVLAKNLKKAKVEGMGEKKVFSDGTRTVEFYHVPGAPHNNGLMIAYIPKEKVLFQGDFSVTPGQPANDHVKALGPVLDKLKLDYNRYINVHVPPAAQTKADVDKSLGK